jgi:F0F1-type ATP synthase membrane subunit b/b'
MARKILAWILIILGSLFLILSIAGIFAIWIYNEPLTQRVTAQLSDIDNQLAQAQTTLQSSEQELARALRFVDASEAALEKLTQQTSSAASLFDNIQGTLDDRLLPELKTTRTRIDSARTSLECLQSVLKGVSNFIPGLDLSAPGKVVSDLIASTKSLDTEIANVESMAQQASTFVSDTSFLLGGDLSGTRESLKNFLTAIQEYENKVADWRQQAADLKTNAPIWIDQASIALTIFLLWFGISQFGILLHGLNIVRGADPFLGLKRTKVVVRQDGVDKIA